MPSERTLRSWGWMGVAVVGGVLISAGPVILLKHHGAFGLSDTARLFVRVVAASLAMAWAVTFATIGYRAHDEFAREASKFAWYWGGALGAGVSLPIYVFVMLGGPRLVGAGLPAAARHAAFLGFAAGYGLMGFSLMAGFVVARVWWTVSKR